MEDFNAMPTTKKIGLGLLAVLVVFLSIYLIALTRNAFTEHSYIGRSDQQIYTITISGEGEVSATPDIAQVNLGVTTEKRDVADAQKENTDKMNNLISKLKDLGIESADIKTTNYNIYPQYNYFPDREQQLRGYQVNQSVTVKIRDLDKINDVLALAGPTGVNQVGGLNFTIDDPEDLQQQAREEALMKAKEKAESLAAIAGVKLGRLVSFNENIYGGPVPVYRDFALNEAVGYGGGGDAPAIQPGSQDITVNVTVTYEVL